MMPDNFSTLSLVEEENLALCRSSGMLLFLPLRCDTVVNKPCPLTGIPAKHIILAVCLVSL